MTDLIMFKARIVHRFMLVHNEYVIMRNAHFACSFDHPRYIIWATENKRGIHQSKIKCDMMNRGWWQNRTCSAPCHHTQQREREMDVRFAIEQYAASMGSEMVKTTSQVCTYIFDLVDCVAWFRFLGGL